ncbi:tRNA nucleotidyltransferase/poly(A) polymerase [Gimesia panareensis]|uniref:tRNA nucleotidyltransferase/poly(A) polymerase n=1 Tax=Gimesia panareensis TaxID=2527978 RepID=A0A518FL50_9PLAN|nr:CCA tRNA nucleotidyltransferase [Gimesia panareensis]QDV17040.1 tRNA nucleotidyltransferase/poly(A) polymerase [Gimesia panareensis]
MKHTEPYQAAVEVVRKLRDAGFQALWAGGCVRDLQLGKEPKDYDVATNALPDEVRHLFGKRHTLAVGASFGVIIVRGHQPDCDVEVATFRTEGPYLDGRRPEHVHFTTAEEDAQRRDFTINGMFYDPINDSIFDYVGGKSDLQLHIIRAIGNPLERMQEDKLRLLRAIRFTATLRFRLDEDTFHAIQTMAEQITVVSPERIAEEMRKMLLHPNREYAMELACSAGLLKPVIPELASLWETEGSLSLWQQTLKRLEILQTHHFETAFAALLLDLPVANDQQRLETVYQICKQLRFSNHELNLVHWLIEQRESLQGASSFSLSRLKRLLAHPDFPFLLELVEADLRSRNQSLADLEFCRQYRDHTPIEVLNPPPLLTGNDLIAAGIKSGPQFKELLTQIQDAQLEERIHTQADAQALLEQLVKHK